MAAIIAAIFVSLSWLFYVCQPIYLSAFMLEAQCIVRFAAQPILR